MDVENLKLYLKNRDYKQVGECLRDVFAIKSDANGQRISAEFSKQLVDLLVEALTVASKESADLLDESSKALRNYALNSDTRGYLGNEGFLKLVVSIVESDSSKPNSPFRKYLFQLLLNILTLNDEVVRKMYVTVYESICNYFLKDSSCLYETSALIYNLTRYVELTDLKIISRVISLYGNREETNEFLLFLMEKIICEDYFWKNYSAIEMNDRLTVLKVLRELLVKGDVVISDACVQCLVKLFLNSTNVIFQVTNSDKMTYETSTAVEVLSALSSEKTYSKLIRGNKDILITAGVLLINLHKLGKISNNCLTPIQKLKEVQRPNHDIRENPFFCFKADLIRLIGNVCWRDRKMQDLAREAEVIPVLLDCCNIDANNPFIIQWVILAVRNLCDNNPENQKFIASLRTEGTVSSALLEEFGLTLHSQGDETIRIVPLNR
ncbi:ataxin-10 [Cylas formicarius]|uniref:ataxin-10 n=1 Tax=Cylas formicarius TaxID=197179 RepID=UPI0029583D94|nr:ataxin-10 [Cylas formicarius]